MSKKLDGFNFLDYSLLSLWNLKRFTVFHLLFWQVFIYYLAWPVMNSCLYCLTTNIAEACYCKYCPAITSLNWSLISVAHNVTANVCRILEKVNQMLKSESVDENELSTAFYSLPTSSGQTKKSVLSPDEGSSLIYFLLVLHSSAIL